MAKKIYFTNFKGGAGVTTCCTGLGIALAEAGERTLIVDGDVISGCGIQIGGCANMQTYTLADFENGACRAKQTLISHPKIINLSYVASLGLKKAESAERAVDELDGLFDYIILDKIALNKCDGAIIVTEPFTPSIKAADASKSYLSDGGIKNIGLFVNKLNGGQILNGEIMTAHEIAALLRLPLKAVIPEDLSLPLGKWKKSTMKVFKVAADTIMGRKELILNVMKDYFGLNGYIKRKVRERL